ncbi:MAG: ADP-ribosylglycohydrolase family protein, partial [Firmicutes bacterium]|nr:ADP-ribosylglycohydrolase family protein [Bacillota bacterium]
PFEGWSYEKIMDELGEINYYVNEKLNLPLVVPDDDISGTFTFIRALEDYNHDKALTPAQIGQTWLNYLIENRTILWWGGMGNSTEHTAYLRLKNGIMPPESGFAKLNGQVVSEQIGAQIFIDAWAMLFPGDPFKAADFACRASQVSHDGEAIYGAQVIAAMEAQAFIEPDLNKLLDTALGIIPKDSTIYRMINDIREWHSKEPNWRKARKHLETHYGYDKYGGNCHIVPNHGLIILSLLYGDDDFQKSLMIVNTSGWDTDCNSGNVGCLMGIKNGLSGINNGPDFRSPIADRLYLPTADGGRAISDAVQETYFIVNMAKTLVGQSKTHPKHGARFHFELPGALQGFLPEDSIESQGILKVENVKGYSKLGERSLALQYSHLAAGRLARAATATFIPKDASGPSHYALIASPTLYPGETVRARICADPKNNRPVDCSLYVSAYNGCDQLCKDKGPGVRLLPGAEHEFAWTIPDMDGQPIAEIGIEISSNERADGTIYLDYITWDGTPNTVWKRPADGGTMWQRAWVDGLDQLTFTDEPFRLIHNEGTGLMMQGSREWTDYTLSAAFTPHMCEAFGVAVRVQGMRRYYALLLQRDGRARLVKELDGTKVLAETNIQWEFGKSYDLKLAVDGGRLKAWVGTDCLFDIVDHDRLLRSGAIGLVCKAGRAACHKASVRPVTHSEMHKTAD